MKKLRTVNEYRNGVVHRNRALSPAELSQLADVSPEVSPADIHHGLLNILREVLKKPMGEEQMHQKGVARSLYEWGLEQLQSS